MDTEAKTTLIRPVANFFTIGCEVCGRKMMVRTEMMGEEIQCQHCTAATIATLSQPGKRRDLSLARSAHCEDGIVATNATHNTYLVNRPAEIGAPVQTWFYFTNRTPQSANCVT